MTEAEEASEEAFEAPTEEEVEVMVKTAFTMATTIPRKELGQGQRQTSEQVEPIDRL